MGTPWGISRFIGGADERRGLWSKGMCAFLSICRCTNIGLQISSLQILFSIQKHLSSVLSSASSSSVQPQFHVSHFKKIVSGLLLCPPSARSSHNGTNGREKFRLEPDVRNCFVDTWFSVHDDIRWFFLREAVYVYLNFPPRHHYSCI
jgi:U3 small nucleolar RNA-associated protein 19